MSEYQYYEFQAIDRPLSDTVREEVSALSSRAQVTSHSASFVYNYSNFRGDPEALLAEHFDAMLYITNWGSRQLMFRLPRALTDEDTLALYCVEDMIETRISDDYLILNIRFDDEEGGGDWVEGEGWLPSLMPLRRDVLQGDFRLLYLAWLKAADEYGGYGEETAEEQEEPPVPAKLKKLSKALRDFINFFEINKNLVKIAAKAKAAENEPSKKNLEAWVEKLPIAERNAFLVRLAKGEQHVDIQLLNRLKQLASKGKKQPDIKRKRRTVAELEAAKELHEKQEEEQRRKEAEAARIRELEALAQKEQAVWHQIDELLEHKQPKPYDEAVKLLCKLRDLAEYRNETGQFQNRIKQIHIEYKRRFSFIDRLCKAGLIP